MIYDVDLTLTLPARLTATSGMNAIAHAVEALYARDANPIISLMAEEGIRALAAGLPTLIERPQDKDARSKAQYGAWLCGTTLGSVGMALHHKICHALGGAFDLPHARTHAVVLPHVLALNGPGAPDALARVARALDVDDAVAGLWALADEHGVPRGLRALGMPEDGIEKAAALTEQAVPEDNPVPVGDGALLRLVRAVWSGEDL